MTKKDIGKALQKARNSANLTCVGVARHLGNSEKTVSAWEQGNGQPDIHTLIKLCEIYNLSSINELVGHVVESNLLNTLRIEEKSLVNTYRRLNTNSKQIVMTVARMELKHIDATNQADSPIKVLQKSQRDVEFSIDRLLSKKPPAEKEKYLKVFTQRAAAGYGNYVDDSDFEELPVKHLPNGTEFGVRISGDSMQPDIYDGDIVFVKRQQSIEVGEVGIFIHDGDALCKQLIYKDDVYYLRSLNSRYKDIAALEDATYTVGKVLGTYNEENSNS